MTTLVRARRLAVLSAVVGEVGAPRPGGLVWLLGSMWVRPLVESKVSAVRGPSMTIRIDETTRR